MRHFLKMNVAEAWRLSSVAYREMIYRSLAEEKGRMWWGAFGRDQQDNQGQDELELAKRVLRIARFDKLLVSAFSVIVALVPFILQFFGEPSRLASSVSLSLAITFGLLALYAIQTLPAFVSAKSSELLSTLPLEEKDFSLINFFSFVRSADFMVLGVITCQVLAVTYFSGSFVAALVMLGVSAMNALFAYSIALWFSRIFQKNLVQGGRSKAHTAFRLVFILMWSLLLLSVGFLFSVPWYILPNLENLLLSTNFISTVLSFVYPFSTGIVVANITYVNFALNNMRLASVALLGYALLSLWVGKWSLDTVRTISRGTGIKIVRKMTADFSVKISSPLRGYILKDVKVASRNPATAFFFALPVLETVIVTLLISNGGSLRTAMVLDATAMGAIFTLFLPLALLSAEGRGFEYTKSLPISSRRIVASKALVATLTYVPVPLALTILSLIKPLAAPSAILIPFCMTIAVALASIFEIRLFLGAAAKGKIASLLRDFEKLALGFVIVISPLIMYGMTFLWSNDHVFALLTMGAVMFGELCVALLILRGS
jgi:predicted permease